MLKRGFVSTFSLMRIIPSGLFSTLGDTLGDVEFRIPYSYLCGFGAQLVVFWYWFLQIFYRRYHLMKHLPYIYWIMWSPRVITLASCCGTRGDDPWSTGLLFRTRADRPLVGCLPCRSFFYNSSMMKRKPVPWSCSWRGECIPCGFSQWAVP